MFGADCKISFENTYSGFPAHIHAHTKRERERKGEGGEREKFPVLIDCLITSGFVNLCWNR